MSIKNTVTDLFSEQVKKSPDGIAIVFENIKITYKELDEKSNQLANYLIILDKKPGDLIPVCINRSSEMIISIIAILKVGCAYVPIDPNYPVERINFIIQDCGANLCITNTKSSRNLSKPVILVDDFFNNDTASSTDLPIASITDTDLAYVIYTSGTTGKPKGVMIEHRTLISYITNQSKFLGITYEDKIIQFSNFCFDASVEQIFLALLNGSELYLITEDTLKDIDAFTKFLEENFITHLHATPGFIENILPEKVNHLKRIVSAGDICKKELFKKWIGKVDFYNKYGPTEATISVLECLCKPEYLNEQKTLPIGKPVSGNVIYLLDENLSEVGTEKIGEIYIGGTQLGRGYLNQPDLTAANFITNPFNGTERLYKTGDLARKLIDGNIGFIGRSDDQVKIRGYRIELSEIENVLREATDVQQCVVNVQDDNNFGKRLIAYVVANRNFNKEAVIQYLNKKLPEYMIPQFVIQIERIPLNGNGKIDKKALPLPDAFALKTNSHISPKTDTEKKIAVIWQNILGIGSVGSSDNFFELGGNSLLAQKFVLLLKEEQVNLPIVKLYQHPNIADIAAFLDGTLIKPQLRNAFRADASKSTDVAIIGMSVRLPGADSIEEFWDNLVNGKETIRYFSDDELDNSISYETRTDNNYVKARGLINNPKEFDPAFFGIN
ncbi:MAG: amino acid adenylation domain-containing protein, partial [Pedobacter sp.]